MLSQKWATLIILVVAALVLGTEYAVKRWYPVHEQHVEDAALKQLPYQKASLGLQMQVAAGIYGAVADTGDSVKIYRSHISGGSPSITITLLPNPDGASQFTERFLDQAEATDAGSDLPGYQFQHVRLADRDAYIITRPDPQSKITTVTARVIAPDRIIQAVCTTGGADQEAYTQACNESLDSIQLSGPPSKIQETPYNLNQ
ncbi:MAG: hypothetical protein ACRD19_11600 [Terriglobia bacterium]